MAEMNYLDATPRSGTGKGAARSARREGLVPGVIYGGGTDPQPISVKFNELFKLLKKGKFLATLLELNVGGAKEKVICRGVQRDVVKDLPTHVDFLRLSEKSRINLYIPVEFINHDDAPGLKKGGALTIVRAEVEMKVTAGNIPEKLVVDLAGREFNDVIHMSDIDVPEGSRPMITDRDFVIANIAAPSGIGASDDEDGEGAEE